MRNLCIFVLAITVLGVSCLPSRQRRQFDWAEWEDNNSNSDFLGTRSTRQRGSWDGGNRRNWAQNGGNQGMGRQLPPNNGNDFDFNQGQNGLSTTTQGTTTTRASASFMRCNSACQATPEYNPVCGTDGETYHNFQRLTCASICGRNVQLERGGTCQPL